MKTIHPAIAEHAMEEIEKLRGLLDRTVTEVGRTITPELRAAIDAALSQQAEPIEPRLAQDEQYPPCDFCGVIPDHHPWHGSGMFNGEDSPHIHACNDCRHLLPTRPAQTAPRCQCCGYLVTDSEHRGCLRAATPSPAQAEQQPVAHMALNSSGFPEKCLPTDPNGFPVYAAPIAQTAPQGKFRMGDRVKKSTGSEWVGRVCGWYSTNQTPEGYAVESSAHRNSVQIYPAKALEAVE